MTTVQTIGMQIAKLRKETPDGTVNSFTDESSISRWAVMAAKDVAAYGIISGYPDGTYGPKNNINRAEAATMLTNTNK